LIGRPETYGKAKEDKGILNDPDWIDEYGLQLVIIDSVDSMVPPAQENAEIGKQNIALTARFLSAELPRLVEAAARSNVTIVFILQVRMDVGAMFGNPESTSGGKALKHAASVFYNFARLTGSKHPVIKDENDVLLGHTVRCRVDKNKVGPPYKSGDFMIRYTQGMCNQEEELVAMGIENGIVQQPTSKKYLLNRVSGEPVEVVGKDAFIERVSSDPELVEEIRNQLVESGVRI
jgi:recombination protein RecA